MKKKIPAIFDYYMDRNWVMPEFIDRVYVIEKAKKLLGFEPKYNIGEILKD